MSLLDDIEEKRTDLSKIANSSNVYCSSLNVLTKDVEKMEYEFQLYLGEIPYVRSYNDIPVLNSIDKFAETYCQYIEMILENNNMFKEWALLGWKSKNAIIGDELQDITFNGNKMTVAAILTYRFDLRQTFSVESVVRFISQLYQIPLSGPTTVFITHVTTRVFVDIWIDDSHRKQIFYDSLVRLDKLKWLMRLFTDDEKKKSFERMQVANVKYRQIGRPDGCVNYLDICEKDNPLRNFELNYKKKKGRLA